MNKICDYAGLTPLCGTDPFRPLYKIEIMKCLTYSESKDWLASIGVQIDGNRDIMYPIRPKNLMTTMPKSTLKLMGFSAQLAKWSSCNVSRMLWLSNWETHPPYKFSFFKQIRLGLGESRTPIEAPGHFFENSSEEEEATIIGLMFVIMAFNWECYVVSGANGDYVYLGDQFIVFSSADDDKLKETSKLIVDFNLEVITDIKNAWK